MTTPTSAHSRGLAMLLVVALLPVGGLADGPERINDNAHETAVRLEKHGRWSEAAAIRRAAALRDDPRQADGHVKLAIVAYLMANQLAEAERFVEEVLQRAPGYHEVLFYLGDSQRVVMQYAKARTTLQRLLSVRPKHARGTHALAHVLLRLGHPQKALPLFEKLFALPVESAELGALARIDFARALRQLGRSRAAAGVLVQVLEDEPFHSVALAEAAQTFFLLGKPEAARALREQHAWLFKHGHQLSTHDENKLHPTAPDSSGAMGTLGLQAADRREFLVALQKLEAAWRADRTQGQLAGVLARLWLRLHRPNECLRVVEAAIRQGASDQPSLLSIRASALEALGQNGEARACRREASNIVESRRAKPPAGALVADLEIHLKAGRLELETGGDLERASEFFRRAAGLAPEDWRPLCGMGRVALERGDREAARKHLDAALRRVVPAGEDAETTSLPAELRRWRGVAVGLSGDLRTAAREIMRLIRRDPREMKNFDAFERVFGKKREEAVVARVLAMKAACKERARARESMIRSMASSPFRECGARYLALGKLLSAEGDGQGALDCFLLAAALQPQNPRGLREAAILIEKTGGRRLVFHRLNLWRGVLERSPDDAAALEHLARGYMELDVRLDEAERLALRFGRERPGKEAQALLETIRNRRRAVEKQSPRGAGTLRP